MAFLVFCVVLITIQLQLARARGLRMRRVKRLAFLGKRFFAAAAAGGVLYYGD